MCLCVRITHSAKAKFNKAESPLTFSLNEFLSMLVLMHTLLKDGPITLAKIQTNKNYAI